MKEMGKLRMGVSDFESYRQSHGYYVDKSLLIKTFYEDLWNGVLITRPRRFGKTLNLSMLRYFFEKSEPSRRALFEGLAIEQHPEIMEHQGKYPVIFLTLKDVKSRSFEEVLEKLKILIGEEVKRHHAVVSSLDHDVQALANAFIHRKSSFGDLSNSFRLLTQWLHEATGVKPLLFIDEYDAPVHEIYLGEDYQRFMSFYRNFISAGLKDNAHLEKACLTGILRVSKESIFSGLNNFATYALLDERYATHFGLTEEEVQQVLSDFNLSHYQSQVQQWYNGYLFGKGHTIYNPWSFFSFVARSDEGFKAYWLNSSSNELVKELILSGGTEVQQGLESLVAGGSIQTELDDHIVFPELKASAKHIWSLLLFSGYLKPISQQQIGHRHRYELTLPNVEVVTFFESTVKNWLSERIGNPHLDSFLDALVRRDYKVFGKYLNDFVRDILSYHDVPHSESERVYHAFVLGLLVQLQGTYVIRSNRESGYGRYDVMLTPKDPQKHGVIFEFKKLESDEDRTPEAALESALKQIEKLDYAAELRVAGVTSIDAIAVVVDQKRVWMKVLPLA